MKRLFLLAILVLTLAAGCRQPEAARPPEQIVPNPGQVSPALSKFVNFSKLPIVTVEPDADGVKFLGVGFAANGAYIAVSYAGPRKIVHGFNQGDVYVFDEKTHRLYKDVPVMPIVGPLVGRPEADGQPGYTMLINYNQDIKIGSLVSVVIGKYRREHYIIPDVSEVSVPTLPPQ